MATFKRKPGQYGCIESKGHQRLNDYQRCETCKICLDPEQGEAFLTDDGGIFCADHYPDQEEEA